MSILHNISALMGVAAAAALIAYALTPRAAYRRSRKSEVRGLRAEVQAESESLRAMLEALPAKIELAKRSRIALARAAGTPMDEGSLLGEADFDLSEAERLSSQLSAAHSEESSLSDMELEIKLVEILAMSLRAGALADKYPRTETTDGGEPIDHGETFDDGESIHGGEDTRLLEAAHYSLATSGSPVRESVS